MYASQCKLEETGAMKNNETSNLKENKGEHDAKKIKHDETVKNLARDLNEGAGVTASGAVNVGPLKATVSGEGAFENAAEGLASGLDRHA